MKILRDIEALQRISGSQAGVFSTSDLRAVLAEKHPAQFVRRVLVLEREHVIARFVRGFYVVPNAFDLPTLSQRLAPDSYVSFGAVLAKGLIVGPVPERDVWAVKMGRSRVYEGAGCRIVQLGVDARLFFGFARHGAVQVATPEKALVDTLYFHLRGKRFAFDVFSDLNLTRIDRAAVAQILGQYRNPKFVTFVKGILDAAR